MNISGFFRNTANEAKTLALPEKYAKEVREICEDLTQNTNYKDVKVTILDPNNVQIVGTDRDNTLTAFLDFEHWTQKQIEKTKNYVQTIAMLSPVRECTQEMRGTIDGVVKRVRTLWVYKDRTSGKPFNYKTDDYENLISGNQFRRQETSDGKVTFFRKVDDQWVEMFNKQK